MNGKEYYGAFQLEAGEFCANMAPPTTNQKWSTVSLHVCLFLQCLREGQRNSIESWLFPFEFSVETDPILNAGNYSLCLAALVRRRIGNMENWPFQSVRGEWQTESAITWECLRRLYDDQLISPSPPLPYLSH